MYLYIKKVDKIYQYIFNNVDKLTKRELVILLYMIHEIYDHNDLYVTKQKIMQNIKMGQSHILSTLKKLKTKGIIIQIEKNYYFNNDILLIK